MENTVNDTMADMIVLDSTTTTNECSKYFTATETFSPIEEDVAQGSNSKDTTAALTSTSPYFSKRIETMVQSRSKFFDAVEFEIECSKIHWSQVDSAICGVGSDGDEDEEECAEEVGLHEMQVRKKKKSNREVFENMMKHPDWGKFFTDYSERLVLRRKIGEGGQAEIFEAMLNRRDGTRSKTDWAVKVFKNMSKSGSSLQALRKQWPDGIYQSANGSGPVLGATMLGDDRFAFVMPRFWGDLRRLIDMRMQQTRSFFHQGAPFPPSWASWCMGLIAHWMVSLHKAGIVHRDLKAANVLMRMKRDSDGAIVDMKPWVVDYECSVGVVGTLFWRAPEILLGLKNKIPTSTMFSKFTEKSDVYSYGMTCYEIVTGRIPFEELRRTDYDPVLNGQRPALPSGLDFDVKNLITKCWHQDPSQRPTFAEIVKFFIEVDYPSDTSPSFWNSIFSL